jgi:hypothetical protein
MDPTDPDSDHDLQHFCYLVRSILCTAEALGAVAYKKTEDVDEYAPRGGARKKKGKGTAAAATANKENAEIAVEKKVVAAVSNVHVLLITYSTV